MKWNCYQWHEGQRKATFLGQVTAPHWPRACTLADERWPEVAATMITRQAFVDGRDLPPEMITNPEDREARR